MPDKSPEPAAAQRVTKLVHDLAGSLTVLALCIPELEQKWQKEKTSSAKKGPPEQELAQLLKLSHLAVLDAQAQLKGLRQQVELLELEAGE